MVTLLRTGRPARCGLLVVCALGIAALPGCASAGAGGTSTAAPSTTATATSAAATSSSSAAPSTGPTAASGPQTPLSRPSVEPTDQSTRPLLSTKPTKTPALVTQETSGSGGQDQANGSTALASTWATAVQAMADDNAGTFLTVAAQSVYDELTTVQQGAAGASWNDWDVMGGHSDSAAAPSGVTVTAGPCADGVEQDSGQVAGDPSVTCHLDLTATDGSGSVTTMGLFYLHQGADGSWSVVDYVRQYQ